MSGSKSLHVISPTTHAAPNGLQSDADALALVFGACDHIRRVSGSTSHVHLFFACTAPLAAVLGHYWHRVTPVTGYEHTGTQLRTFLPLPSVNATLDSFATLGLDKQPPTVSTKDVHPHMLG